jgi:hypothetical protein
MKPTLPLRIEAVLPDDVLRVIYEFVPHLPKPKKVSPKWTVSPTMERDLRRIQSNVLKGKNELYMRDLEDFLLL